MTCESAVKQVSKRPLPEILQVPWGIKEAVLLIVLWLAAQVVLGVVLGAAGHFSTAIEAFVHSTEIATTFTFYLVQVAIGLALVWVFARRHQAGWKTLGWRRVSVWRTAGYILVIFIGFIILAQLALLLAKVLIPGFDPNQAQTNDFTQAPASGRSLALIALVLLPPIFEETIFRGFIFPAFAKRTGVIGGAVISSVLFGAAHAQPNLFVYTTVLGLLLCFMYLRLKSIVPGILLHMVNNYLAFLAITHK